MESSIIYSMGTALNRARDHDVPVEVLVGGEWLAGQVVAVDGHGVLLDTDEFEHAVVRMESVQAVRVHGRIPEAIPIPAQARPMYASS
jgi:sRNA-binding regulator protein Hfq